MQLPLGVLCRECRSEIERKASRWGRWVAGVSTALLAVYVLVRMPATTEGRVIGVVAVGIWYLLTDMVVRRAARELLP